MTQTQMPSIQVIPRMLADDFDLMDQLFSFAIFVLNNGNAPITIKEVGLMRPKAQKTQLKSPFLDGIKALPAVLQPRAQFRVIFHPEQDARDVYVSAYVETEDGTIIEGKSYDLTLLSEG